ncbi:hypothetical protein DRB07_03835 [Actinomyces sp. Z3]|nr:hypothetical protein DRB07_03835 [Actinomyces sp. Z3]
MREVVLGAAVLATAGDSSEALESCGRRVGGRGPLTAHASDIGAVPQTPRGAHARQSKHMPRPPAHHTPEHEDR